MPSILNLMHEAVGQPQDTVATGHLSAFQPAPTHFTDPLYVVIDGWSTDHYHKITRWSACNGLALPQPGCEVLLQKDGDGSWVCVWWDGAATPLPWLVVDGTTVREGGGYGPRYRATGWNSYVMKNAGGLASQTMTASQRDAFFARLRPNSLIRVWFFAPAANTYTWAQVLAELDAIVATAKKNHVRIIAGLTDWGGNANDAYGPKTSAWMTGQQYLHSVYGANSYQDWLTTVVTRYAAEPTVAAYDLCNEPMDSSGSFTTALATFAQTASGWIKAINPNALVYMGVQFGSAVGGSTAYQTIFSHLDFCSLHHYDAIGYVSSLSSVVASARALGKPLLIDEYGFWAKAQYGAWSDTDKDTNGLPAMSYAAQGRIVRDYLQNAFDIPEVFGALVWSGMDTGPDQSWFTGLGMYEPLNNSEAARQIHDTAIPGGEGPLNDLVSSMEGWVDSVFTARYPPGTQIGGPNSGSTTLNLIYDRLNTNLRQATQALAPTAATYRLPSGQLASSLQFNGSQVYPHSNIHTGVGSASAMTFCAVIVPTAIPGAGYAYLIAPLTGSAGFSVRVNSTGQVEVYQYATAIIFTGTTVLQPGTMYFVEVRWDSSGGGGRMRINGNNEGTWSSVKTLANDTAVIGAEAAGTNGFAGHMLEMWKTSTNASAAEQSRYYTYVERKYSIAGV